MRVAEVDDDLINKYLEGEELTLEEVRKAVKQAIASGVIVPVFTGSATKNIGVATFMDAVTEYFPSPLEGSVKAEDGTELKADASGARTGPNARNAFGVHRSGFLPARRS